MHTILQRYELLNLALKEQRWSLFVFFISSTLITFYDFNFHFLWEKQPFSRHPQLKTKKERKRRIYYSITLATVYIWWRSFTGHCGPWTLLLYCSRIKKTNKQTNQIKKQKSNSIVTPRVWRVSKICKFCNHQFFGFASLLVLTSEKIFHIKPEMPIKGTLIHGPCSWGTVRRPSEGNM